MERQPSWEQVLWIQSLEQIIIILDSTACHVKTLNMSVLVSGRGSLLCAGQGWIVRYTHRDLYQ
jgi:hypothetical protein